jgi:DeoR/GlpR family transcriptional regulator of sugar metabolism
MLDWEGPGVRTCATMSGKERRERILEIITEQGFAAVKDLSRTMDVSEMTIRRDLERLDGEGKMVRHHGGAASGGFEASPEHAFSTRQREAGQAKLAIGIHAATLVAPGEVVFLDGGTTTLEAARRLTQERLTVVSNCLPALQVLGRMPSLKVIGLGGEFIHENQCFVGPDALGVLEKLYANVVLLSTTCLSFERGLTNRDAREADLKRLMVDHSDRVILVMDSSKMNKQTLSHVCGLDQLDVLVTDDGLRAEDRAQLEKVGVRVDVVSVTSGGARSRG